MTLQKDVGEEIKGAFTMGFFSVLKELESLNATFKNIHLMVQKLSLEIPRGNERKSQLTWGSKKAQ